MAEESTEVLLRIERTLNAILTLTVEQIQKPRDGVAKTKPRSIDRLLSDSGLSGVEIARILGKSPQAVSNMLARETKAKAKPAKPGCLPNSKLEAAEGDSDVD